MKVAVSDYIRGAAVATDLINSAGRVRRTTGEQLGTCTALTVFLRDHDIVSAGRPSRADLELVHRLRDRTRTLVLDSDEDQLVVGATALLGDLDTSATLVRDDRDRWQWAVTTRPAASMVVRLSLLVGIGLLGTVRALGVDRFRGCASPVCDGAFIDATRAGRRRYCMPELCGNRVNVANHRARHAADGADR